MSVFLAVAWLLAGILVLCIDTEITKLQYGLVWMCLLIELFKNCI